MIAVADVHTEINAINQKMIIVQLKYHKDLLRNVKYQEIIYSVMLEYCSG